MMLLLVIFIGHYDPSITGVRHCNLSKNENWKDSTYWITLIMVKCRTACLFDYLNELVSMFFTCVNGTVITRWIPMFSFLKVVKIKTN